MDDERLLSVRSSEYWFHCWPDACMETEQNVCFLAGKASPAQDLKCFHLFLLGQTFLSIQMDQLLVNILTPSSFIHVCVIGIMLHCA